MCTECLTTHIRTLVEIDCPDCDGCSYYTLRAGHGVFGGNGIIICDPQEEIASFRFMFYAEDGSLRPAETGDDPKDIEAFVQVLDPIGWVHFFTHFVDSQDGDEYDILKGLEDEVAALFPRLDELCRESREAWGMDDDSEEGSDQAH